MKKVYVGIADAHGLESFIPIEKTDLFALKMRSMANAHRHAIVYRIEVSQFQIDSIDKLLKEQDYKGVLIWIKKHVKDISVEGGREKSWKLIPNDDLDPWS